RRSTNVDVLDEFFELYSRLGGGFLEGIEIDDHHVDWNDAVFGDRGHMFGIVAPMQNAAVNFRVQRLDSAVEHLGESGELGNVFDRNARVAQKFGSAAGRDEFDAERGKFAGEI